MTIQVRCAECFQEFRVKDELAGKKIRCKGCQAVMTVSEAEEMDADSDDFGDDDGEEAPPIKSKRTQNQGGSKSKKTGKKSGSKSRATGGNWSWNRSRVFAAIAVLWGGAASIRNLMVGFAPSGDRAYDNGLVIGIGFAGVMFVVGLYFLLAKDRRPD
ncbi:MAG: hypothetical protein JWM11_5682 [Planctomycetaceae bacterium]|nr:hypothetical protein [Planctomycetaceae bacterium]